MLISHKHGLIYIKSRKTAGTSLEIGLSRHTGPKDVITPFGPDDEVLRSRYGGRKSQNCAIPLTRWRTRDWIKAMAGKPPKYSRHTAAYVIRRYLPSDQWEGYFKFTFDRNPWDLTVSAYHWYHRRDLLSTSFTEFVFSEALANYSNWRLYTIGDEVVVDRVYRYDQLAEALGELSERIGLTESLDLPRAKGIYRQNRRPYWEMYGEPERQRVGEVFRNEIAEFGWKFGE